MVLSLAYLLTELDSKVKCHTAQLEEIDCKADKLDKQAASIEYKLEAEIDLFIDQLIQRKEALKDVLWQIVAREDKQLAKKKAEILEHVKMLKGLENMAFQDGTKFRELYGHAAEKSCEFESGINDVIDLKLSADCPMMSKNIGEFGTISYNICEKGGCEIVCDVKSDDGSIHQSHFAEDTFDVVNKEEAAGQDIKERSASDVLSCELYGSCNCLDVCEDTGSKVKGSQVEPKEVDSGLGQWLWHPKENLSSDGADFIFDNRIASQLESLHLSQVEQATEFEQQQILTSKVNDNLQCWLTSKHRSLNANANEMSADNSAICKVWDKIKARALLSWLKPEVKPVSSVEDKNKADGNAAQIDSIHSIEKRSWLIGSPKAIGNSPLIRCNVADQEKSITNLSQYEAVKSTTLSDWLKTPYLSSQTGLNSNDIEDRSIDYGTWLKRKLGDGCEEPESETTKVYKRIKSTPLESWLKFPKSQRSEMELCGAKSMSVDKAHDITCLPLEMWLKQMTISSDMEQNKYDEWLVSKSKLQKESPCHTSNLTILKQFDEIASSSLHGWIKATNRMPKPMCRGLCKWLKTGPLEGCKTCCLAPRHNSNLLR